MANPHFMFKQFTICHDKCAMKVGTDGVLLGAWVDVKGAARILDVGTGTGLIAIMMAQRTGAFIDAVEIDENAGLQAEENVAACPWKERISIYQDSLHHFTEITSTRYELIVSNPPYFRNSLKPPKRARSLARHDERLSYESLLFYTSQLLTHGGRLAMIIPANEIDHLTEKACFQNLFPSQLLMVKPVPHKSYSRSLVEFTNKRNITCIKNELIIKRDDCEKYTDDYMALTEEYYLMF